MNTAEQLKKDKTIPRKYDGPMLRDFLEEYKLIKNISTEELCSILGWKKQYYSKLAYINKDTGEHYIITLSTVLHVADRLHIPPRVILENLYGEEVTESEVTAFIKGLPSDVKAWLCTKEGKEYLLKGFEEHIEKKSQQDIDKRIDIQRKLEEQKAIQVNNTKMNRARKYILQV